MSTWLTRIHGLNKLLPGNFDEIPFAQDHDYHDFNFDHSYERNLFSHSPEEIALLPQTWHYLRNLDESSRITTR